MFCLLARSISVGMRMDPSRCMCRSALGMRRRKEGGYWNGFVFADSLLESSLTLLSAGALFVKAVGVDVGAILEKEVEGQAGRLVK